VYVGSADGGAVGACVGLKLGLSVGVAEGLGEGAFVLGASVGVTVGPFDGTKVGAMVGLLVGGRETDNFLHMLAWASMPARKPLPATSARYSHDFCASRRVLEHASLQPVANPSPICTHHW
jgi:hypothetical protein